MPTLRGGSLVGNRRRGGPRAGGRAIRDDALSGWARASVHEGLRSLLCECRGSVLLSPLNLPCCNNVRRRLQYCHCDFSPRLFESPSMAKAASALEAFCPPWFLRNRHV